MPLYLFKNATKSKNKQPFQYLTLVIPVKKLTQKKKNILIKIQKEFTECVDFFLTEACNRNTTSIYKLHKICYATAKNKFSLSTSMIQTARDRAIAIQRIFWARVRKWKKTAQPKINKLLPIHLRQKSYSLFQNSKGTWFLKFPTSPGRKQYIYLPLNVRPYICQYLENSHYGAVEIYPNKEVSFSRKSDEETERIKHQIKWKISLTVKVPFKLKSYNKTIGIDLGIRHPAVLSNNKFFSGKKLRHIRFQQFKKRFKQKKLKNKEHRQITHINHQISKQIVNIALKEKTNLALENLTGIRERLLKQKNTSLTFLSHWAYKQLIDFIVYKASLAGIKVDFVDPSGTSITCSKCGYKDEKNRINQSTFRCKSCGFELNADLNASRNIALLSMRKSIPTGHALSERAEGTAPCG